MTKLGKSGYFKNADASDDVTSNSKTIVNGDISLYGVFSGHAVVAIQLFYVLAKRARLV